MSIIWKSEARSVPWRASDVALGISAAVVGLVILVVAYGAISDGRLSAPGLAVIGGLSGCILVLASWAAGPRRHGAYLGSLGLRLPSSTRALHLLVLPLGVLVVSLTITGVYGGLLSLLGWDLPASLPEEFDLAGPGVLAALGLVVILWGPLAEEVFFRGFVFPGLAGRIGLTWGAVATSLLFALFHVDPRVLLPIFVTGMLLAWLYQKTGCLWSCFVAHAAQNALAFSLGLWA